MKPTWKKYLLYARNTILKNLLILILLIILGQIILSGYPESWTGFGAYTSPTGEYVREKTLWDWMQLLIIPLFLTGAAVSLNRSEKNVERQLAEDRAKLERDIANDRQQEAALQAYLDRMSDLLLREKLRTSENEEVRDVARIRTLTVLRGLDARRKGLVVNFLHEAGLISNKKTIVELRGADLRGADLHIAFLQDAHLLGANLRHANLNSANLTDAHVEMASLEYANLKYASLMGATLEYANLRSANLSSASLVDANLTSADLEGAILKYADLRGANLTDANLEGIDLRGATMPDGTKHE